MGSLGAHAETNRAVWSARARGSQAVDPWLTSKIYSSVDESAAEPAACWGKARPLQPPAQPYARECHTPVWADKGEPGPLRKAAARHFRATGAQGAPLPTASCVPLGTRGAR